MKRWYAFLSGLLVLVAVFPAGAAVTFSNDWQYSHVQTLADGEIFEENESQDNGGGDADLMAEASLLGYAYGTSRLRTTYTSDRLTVDGRISLDVFPFWDYDEVSCRGHFYYQTHINVTDEPVWVRITGYMTPSEDHTADDHFVVGGPLGYWNSEGNWGQKIWMIETEMFDVGDHIIYGGIDYTITALEGGVDEKLYADLYFVIDIVDAPEFEASQADLDHSGRVDMVDFALFASAWLWEDGLPI